MQYARWLACLFLLGCGSATTLPDARGGSGPIPVWTADADGRPFPVPHVEVALNGHPVDVMLDTGASQHFVLTAAAWAYDVRSRPFQALATDAHGARFSVRLALPGVMQLPGHPTFAPRYVFLLESEPLWASGVLGGLSPQLRAGSDHTALLDLVGGRLEVTDEPPALAHGAVGRVCAAGHDARDGYRFVVPVRVDGTEAELLVDTGAQSTTLYEGSPLAASLRSAPSARTVRIAGAASVVDMRVLERVPFEVGGASVSGRLTIGPGDAQCGESGLLGFDLLRRCRLALDRRAMALSCDDADPPLHRARARTEDESVVLTRVDAPAACGHTASELRPALDASLPFRYASPVEAYVALTPDLRRHAARIEEVCRDEGFLEAHVDAPLARDGRELAIRFAIEEGRRFTVDRVTVSVATADGSHRLESDEMPALRTRTGQPYNHADVVADARALADALTAAGAHVAEAGVGRNEKDDATVDVFFAIALDGPLPRLAHTH